MCNITSFHNLKNRSCAPFDFGYEFDTNFHAPLIVIALFIVITNLLVIVLFIKKEQLRKGGKLLLLSLAISDITTGLVTIPLNIICEMTYSLKFCMSSGLLNKFLAVSTVYHILAVTFETYYAILKPMEHRVKVDKRKVLGIALAIWCASLIIALAPLFWAIGVITDVTKRPTREFNWKMTIYELFVLSFGFLLPLTLMIFAHARMFTTIIRALRLIRRRTTASPNNISNPDKNKYKTAILFAVILLVFIACWLFWFVIGFLKALMKMKYPFPTWAVDCLTILRYSTSFINPLLYTFFRPDFHTGFKSFFRRTSGRRLSLGLVSLLNGSHRAKRDSQTTTTTTVAPREPSTVPILNAAPLQPGLFKLDDEKDTEL